MTPNSFSKISFIFPILIAHFYTVLAQGVNATQEAIVLEAVTKLGWAFTYPNSSKEAASINSTLFADNVQGRVDITNTFDGPELNTEYVFGLFANIAKNNTFSLLPVPISSQTRGLIINGNMAATSALINFRHAATGIEMPMVVDTWIRVNDEGKIDQYEATFKRHDWYFDVLYGLLTPFVANSQNISVDTLNNNITYRDTIFKKLVGESICKIHEDYCTGENQQYASVDDCMGFMMSIPLGQMYQLGQNTAVCRMLHQEMVPERPSVHCAHIGPSGGDMCVERNYTEATEEVYFRSLFIQGM